MVRVKIATHSEGANPSPPGQVRYAYQEKSMKKVVLLFFYLPFILLGCMDRPANIDEHLDEYEKLAQVVASDAGSGQIVNIEQAKGQLLQLMAKLEVRRVRHDRGGKFVLLSGQAGIISGQFSYLYSLNGEAIDLAEDPNDGIERKHIKGRWYIEKAYFD
jgi:hypothetical protein